MIVVIEDGLDNVRQYLESTNKYEIKIYSKYIGPTDAIIYAKEKETIDINEYQNEIRNIVLKDSMSANHGILIITYKDKTPKEIENILDTRLYKNIF